MKHILNFKRFVILENEQYAVEVLGERLSSLQALQNSLDVIGVKTLKDELSILASQIRADIKGHVLGQNVKIKKILRNIGVALCKVIYEKEDAKQTIDSSVEELTSLLTKLSGPINDLGVTTKDASFKTPKDLDNTALSQDLQIDPTVQPVSGFDMGGLPPLGSPPENQNPNAL